MKGVEYKKEIGDYLEYLYNLYYKLFSPEKRDTPTIYDYDKKIDEKYGKNFEEFLQKRGITKDDIADFILAFESSISEEIPRIEPIISAFHRAIGYFILKSSAYRLKNNPVDIFYEDTDSQYYNEFKKYIPMLYSLSLFPNFVDNNEKVGFSVIFFAKKDKREHIKKTIDIIASYLYEIIREVHKGLGNQKMNLLIDYYSYMFDGMLNLLHDVYQRYKVVKDGMSKDKKERIANLLKNYTDFHSNYPYSFIMDEYFKTLSELNKEVGNNEVYGMIARSFVLSLFFTNPFVKLLGIDLMNIVDNDKHLEIGIENLKGNYNVDLAERRFLIRNYKIKNGVLESVDINFYVVESPAEINTLFYKDMDKERFEKLAKVFYDLAMFFSIRNIHFTFSVVESLSEEKVESSLENRAIFEIGFNILGRYLELFDKFERKYIFGDEDFYLNVLNDNSEREEFIELVRLSYFMYDNAIFMFSLFYGFGEDNISINYTIDPIYLSVAQTVFNMPAIPLIFYSTISSFLSINSRRKEDEKYGGTSGVFSAGNNPIVTAYTVQDDFNMKIGYDITDMFTHIYTEKELNKKIYTYLFEAFTAISFQNLTEKTLFTEFSSSGNSKNLNIFEVVKTLKDVEDKKIDFYLTRSREYKKLPIFDKLILAFAGMTADTSQSGQYDHAKADVVKEYQGTNLKRYFNKMLYLKVMEQWNGDISKNTNLYTYIEEEKNPVFNYLGFVIGLTQLAICNPYMTPFFSNIVNCRGNLFTQFLFQDIIQRTVSNNEVLPVNETIIFGPVANYMYAKFLDREFNMKLNSSTKRKLSDYIKEVEIKIMEMREKATNLVDRFNSELKSKYEDFIEKHFQDEYLHQGKKNLLSVYSKRTIKDTNTSSPENIACVVSNVYPATLSLYTAGICVASSMVYASISEMYMYKLDEEDDKDNDEKIMSNVYRIVEDYIYGKLLIPNLLFHWMITSTLYSSNISENYRRTITQGKSILASLISPGTDFKIYGSNWSNADSLIKGFYLALQLYISKIKDNSVRSEYLHIEDARRNLIMDIERTLSI
ncbi:MAG: hypothetical protein RMJ67_01110 [Elusimicrobiota bacterium]|nr:hypothetical protein [Endomicrobiia bacterium]MDW8165102.1 hypothetical protein [Elusimicrobiota bacterium]